MDNVQAKIIERLERYTDHGHDAAIEIARQVMIALDIDDGSDLVVMSENEYYDEMDGQYAAGEAEGREVGYTEAMDHVIAWSTDLRTSYLDEH